MVRLSGLYCTKRVFSLNRDYANLEFVSVYYSKRMAEAEVCLLVQPKPI